jgi:hypothetical protein
VQNKVFSLRVEEEISMSDAAMAAFWTALGERRDKESTL